MSVLEDQPAVHTARAGCFRAGCARAGAVMDAITDVDNPGNDGRWNLWQYEVIPGTGAVWTEVAP